MATKRTHAENLEFAKLRVLLSKPAKRLGS
jgi:hypothetical protein